MFKGEYQGGPFVEVFSAQGGDPLLKKCRVTGSSTNIHKQYEKDVKSNVFILEGEPTTTKIQLPKDDKQTLFLLQKFLVFQIFIPLGRSFSFELGVSDIAQNKRRIFFSSSQKDVTVTPLHAKFPLTVLCLGSWLNLCLDLGSLVGETFSGQTFRALESITVTANCRLRKIFTLKVPPVDTSGDDLVLTSYATTEALPRGLQLLTSPDVHPITQILCHSKLARKSQDEQPTSTPSTTSGNDASSTPRQDSQQTHIAFGSKVVIPPHVRRSSYKENNENTTVKVPRSARSSHARSKVGHSEPDLRCTGEETAKPTDKPALQHKGTQELPSKNDTKENLGKSVNANQAVIQPRPPKTSSAGKVRRAVRVKPTSATKESNNVGIKTADCDNKQENVNITKPTGNISTPNSQHLNEAENVNITKPTGNISTPNSQHLNEAENVNITKPTGNVSTPNSQHLNEADMQRNGDVREIAILDPEQKSARNILKSDKERILNSYNDHIRRTSEDLTNVSAGIPRTSVSLNVKNNVDHLEQGESEKVLKTSVSNINVNSTNDGEKTSMANEYDVQRLSKVIVDPENDFALVTGKLSRDDHLSDDHKIMEKENKFVDLNNNNNEQSNENHVNSNSDAKPRLLLMAGENSVFTFASRPRSPRLGKKKGVSSTSVGDSMSPVEPVPEVTVNLEEDAAADFGKGGRNRGASLEDDFCKLSDDESRKDEDGIKKLLNSSLSPRHSPMPFHHHLRQSIRSSMLKEIPSPINENGYDSQNYQSEPQPATLNQSTASSWRFDLSDSSNGFNQTHQDLEDSLDASRERLARSADSSGIVGNDIDEDVLSDGSDDTTYSTWRTPPQDLRGNKYQNEMKPPGNEPDLTATISMDPRDYCDVFSPPIILPSSTQENSVGVSPVTPTRPSRSSHVLQSPGVGMKQQTDEVEEELDLLYDPFLHCYFDPKTHKYYELS